MATAGLRYDINRWTWNVDAFAPSKQRSPGTGVNADGSFNGNYITEGTADRQYGDIPGYVTWNVRSGYDFGPHNSGMYVGAPRTFFVQASVGL